jgi:curved DNA-binding protein CbpA
VLEVAQGASNEEIRQSYRRLILLHHPDKRNAVPNAKYSGQHDVQAELLNSAYATLSDPAARTQYDEILKHTLGETYFVVKEMPKRIILTERC